MPSLSTSVTLLGRLRSPTDQAAWERFLSIYTPIIYRWARQAGFNINEASDLVQDVLVNLLRALPTFEYAPERGKFRSWLKTIALNRARQLLARQSPDPVDPRTLSSELLESPAFWEEEYDRLLINRALEVMRTEFEETTWRACWEHVTTPRTARDIGTELGLSEAAVFTAKSRVLKRLRQELAGLME